MNKSQTNICKGVAVILLLIHHLFINIDDVTQYGVSCVFINSDMLLYIAQICKVCVSIFVFLTGYGCMRAVQIQGEDSLYWSVTFKRYLRLMFGFWFIFLPALCLKIFVGGINIYGDDLYTKCVNMLFDSLGLAHVFNTPTLNATWWYMSYALLLVLVTPFFIWLSKRARLMVIPITIIVPRFLLDLNEIGNAHFLPRYLLALVLGIICAQYCVFERIVKKFVVADFVLAILFCVILGIFRQKVGYYEIIEALLAMLICYLSVKLIPLHKRSSSLFAFLGEHSMNIFLIHTFIYYYYCPRFIYSFKYAGLILLVLLTTSLMLSVFIEFLKRIVGYDKLEIYVKLYFEKLQGNLSSEIEN